MNSHPHPTHIFTNYLGLSDIVISHIDSDVRLLGLYGSLFDGETYEIDIHTHFETLYKLLDLAADLGDGRKDEVLSAIAHVLAHPSGTSDLVSLEAGGELWFYHHLFAFQAMCEEDDDGHMVVPEDITYFLHGYIEVGEDILPPWYELDWPADSEKRAAHNNRVLGLQYRLYLHFRKTSGNSRAMIMSGLTNSHAFSLARMQYQLDSISEEEN